MRRLVTVAWIAVVAAISFVEPAASQSGGSPVTIPVDDLADNTTSNGRCTLREAISHLNREEGANGDCPDGSGLGDTITLPAGTIRLAANLPGITESVIISGRGVGTSVVDGSAKYAAFDSFGGFITLRDFTVQRAVSTSSGPALDYTSGTVTITRMAFLSNQTTSFAGAVSAPYALVTVTDTTFRGNSSSSDGGALFADDLVMTGSTFSANASEKGDGGGLWFESSATIGNSTFHGNRAGLEGGGIATVDGFVELDYVTFSTNESVRGGAQVELAGSGAGGIVFGTVFTTPVGRPNCGGASMSDEDFNLASDTSCGFDPATSSRAGVASAGLGPLTDNGGPTETRMPSVGSVLVDAIDPSACDAPFLEGKATGSGVGAAGELTDDQRGETRPQDGDADGVARCDIGAVERPTPAAPFTASPNPLDFGSWPVGSLSPGEPLVVRNGAPAGTLTIGTVSVVGTASGDFIVVEDGCSGVSLAPGDDCLVVVAFAPAGAGARTAALRFPTSGSGGFEDVPLRGSGGRQSVSINPAVGPPGTVVTVTGAGWPAGPVRVSVEMTPRSEIVVEADANGDFRADVLVFPRGSVGNHPVIAVSESVTASAFNAFLVTLPSTHGGNAFLYRG